MEQADAARARATEPAADLDTRFEQVFREHGPSIAAYLSRLVDDQQQAEELAQDAFLKAYRALAPLPAEANVRAWLYRIATNCAYDALRRRRRFQWLPFRSDHSGSVNPGALDERVAERDAVRQALRQLPPPYRISLVLYAVEGFSTQEIGEMLHVSANTAKVRIFRARQMFQAAYGEADGELR
ncbi:MAG: sigma-70 family RNA polymerase sigma factor [Chloroflexi bacterium]|nr:sigma-70 family RNA polymerase sigma factor [Chloroflexota bacterium]